MRRLVSIPLVVIGSLVAAFGTLLLWADRRVFDTERVVSTSEQTLAQPAVQALLRVQLTNRIITLTGNPALRPQVDQIVAAELADPTFREEFGQAVRVTHRTLVGTSDEAIHFNLEQLAQHVEEKIAAAIPQLAGKLPDPKTALEFDLVRRSELPAVWHVADTFHSVAVFVIVFGVALVGLGMLLGPSRWLLLLLTGAGLVGFAVITIVLTKAGVTRVTQSNDPVTKEAARAISDAFEHDLVRQSTVLAVIGGVMLLAGAAVGAFTVGRTDDRWDPPQRYHTGWS